jgi:rare lipoprotein A
MHPIPKIPTLPPLAALLLTLMSGPFALLSPMPAAAAGEGIASYYGKGFHGRRTASGQRFDQYAMTAAHRTLRFGTRVRVTNLRNGRDVVVTVNDRGPFVHGRIIDLSRAAASRLGMLRSGVARVRVEVVARGQAPGSKARRAKSRFESDLLRELF